MKHILKYKLFENADFLLEEEIKDFFNTHLYCSRIKDFFNKHNYPFYPIEPSMEYNHDINNQIYLLTYKFIQESINTTTTINYNINYNYRSNITYSIEIKVETNIGINKFILVNSNRKNTLYSNKNIFAKDIEREELIEFLDFKKRELIFWVPSPSYCEDSIDFINLKNFLIDLKLIEVLNKLNSNIFLLDKPINTQDKEYYKLREDIDMTNFRIQKRGNDWIYFDYIDIFDFLCRVSDVNKSHIFLNKRFSIHEQYLYKIVKLYKQIKKEIQDEFDN